MKIFRPLKFLGADSAIFISKVTFKMHRLFRKATPICKTYNKLEPQSFKWIFLETFLSLNIKKKNEKSFYHSSENLKFEKYDVEQTNADSFNFILWLILNLA